MHTKYSLAALSDDALDRGIQTCAARKHTTDAELLAFIAEYDSRRRYLALGYDSMLAFCVEALHLSEDATYKRLQVVRVAREFPAIFPALAEGQLHLTAVNLLAPHLTVENAGELIAAAAHKSKAKIGELLAERYPKKQASRMSLLSAVNEEGSPAAESGNAPSAAQGGNAEHTQLAPAQVEGEQTKLAPAQVEEEQMQLAPAQVEAEQTKLAPAQVEEVDCWARIKPLSGDRYSVSLTIDRATHELWRHNQSLLSHQIPSGNLAEVLRRSLAESARQFEKRRFRSSGKARAAGCRKPGSRHIPKQVRDAVWQRDGGRCRFVGENGHLCGSRTRLEFDHIVPIARGGASTVDNLRLRCRVHNQYEAERELGADFMRHKREQARQATERREERLRVALSFHGATVATPVRVAVDAPAGRATQ